MTVAFGADSSADPGSAVEATRAPGEPQGGVTITVTGSLAADMIGRGETEKREREALAARLRERLDDIEAALEQKAAEQERLEQHVQELRGQLAQLGAQAGDQVTQLRSEIGRMRGGFAEAGDRFRDLQGRLDRLEGAVEGLHGTVGALEGTVGSVTGRVGGLDDKLGSLERSVGRMLQPEERPRLPLLVWRRSLHFWTAIAALTLTATAGALWLYV